MTDPAPAWEQVAESPHVYEAELIALRLRESGIEARVLDQSFRQEPLPSVRSFAVVRVLVPAEFADEARRVLAEASPLPWAAEPAGEMPAGEDPAGTEADSNPRSAGVPLRSKEGGGARGND